MAPDRQNPMVGWDELIRSYDQVAGRYQREFRDELDAKPRKCELLDAFCAAVTDPVVEVGCGPGQVGPTYGIEATTPSAWI